MNAKPKMSSRDDELNARCRKLERQRSEEQIKWRQLDAVCRERKDSWKLWDHLLRMQPSEENREQLDHIQHSETIKAYARELFELYHESALEASKSFLRLHEISRHQFFIHKMCVSLPPAAEAAERRIALADKLAIVKPEAMELRNQMGKFTFKGADALEAYISLQKEVINIESELLFLDTVVGST